MGYVLYLFQTMFAKNSTVYTKTSLINDIYENVQLHYPGKHDGQGTGTSKFDFAFQLSVDDVNTISYN